MTTQNNSQKDSGAAVIDRMLSVLGEKHDKALGDYLGKSAQQVSNAKREKVPMSWINEFCKRNDVTIDWLLTGNGPIPTHNPIDQPHNRRSTDLEPSMIAEDRAIAITSPLDDGRSKVATVLQDYTKMAASVEGQLNYWRSVFEAMSPVCILKEGRVLYQNASNRKMCSGAEEGKHLCITCQGGSDSFPACPSCAVRTASESGKSSTSYTTIDGVYYVIQSDTMMINGEEYQVVLAIPVKRCGEMERKIQGIERDLSLIPSLLAPFPVCCTDREGVVRWQSPSFLSVFSLEPGQIRTTAEMLEMLSERAPDAIGDIYLKCKDAHKRGTQGEVRILLDGKEMWLVLRPVVNKDGESLGVNTWALAEDEYAFFKKKGML